MDFDLKKDYYKTLGVDENASIEDIKKAFKKLAVKHHPDRWGDKAKFQEINEAYQTLWDETKKSQYDAMRKWWFDPSSFWWWGFGGFGWWVDLWDLWDLLGWMFWWWFWWWETRTRQVRRWSDVKIAIDISFEEGFLWTEKKISYSRMKLVDGAVSDQCSNCRWRWTVTQQARTPFGIMQTQVACSHCGGSGHVFKKDWKKLDQWWLEKVKEIVEVKIPAWINDWVFLKFHGKWNTWMSWENWDLYIKINIEKSKIFERKWDDLYVKSDLGIFDLVLWWEIEIHHPEWKLKVKIPKWTQITDMVKVTWKGYGEKWIFNKKWDMYIIPKVSIPKRLSKEQEKLWEELRKA